MSNSVKIKLPSQHVLPLSARLKLQHHTSSKKIWINIQKITLFQTSVWIRRLLLHLSTLLIKKKDSHTSGLFQKKTFKSQIKKAVTQFVPTQSAMSQMLPKMPATHTSNTTMLKKVRSQLALALNAKLRLLLLINSKRTWISIQRTTSYPTLDKTMRSKHL